MRHIWADGGYEGKVVDAARWFCGIAVEVVKKEGGQGVDGPAARFVRKAALGRPQAG